VCRNIAAFEHALLVRVCQLVTTMLQNLLDPRCEKALQESELRVVLRVVRTIIWQFHAQLRNKCSVFMEALLAGAATVSTENQSSHCPPPFWLRGGGGYFVLQKKDRNRNQLENGTYGSRTSAAFS